MAIRIVSWNLNRLTGGKASDSARAALIDSIVQTSGIEADIFLVTEVGNRTTADTPGNPLTGSGAQGSLTLLAKLQSTSKYWRLIPPLSLCNSTENEGIAVYYRSDVLDFDGPADVDYSSSAFKGLEGPATSGTGGQVNFLEKGKKDGNPIWFVYSRNRRPHLVQFKVKKTSNFFRLLGYHAPPVTTKNPPPTQKQEAFLGTAQLATIHEITNANDAANVVVTGDFNCNDFDTDWKKAYDPLIKEKYTKHINGVATTIQRAYNAKPKAFRTANGFDNVFTKGLKLASGSSNRPNVSVIDPVNGFPAGYPSIKAYKDEGYTPDNVDTNKFRSSENYELVRRTSDHLPLYIDIDT